MTPIIGAMLLRADLPASEPFTAMFSAGPFPDTHMKLVWIREEFGGNWYRCETTGIEGWLCPCLLRFFDIPPKSIYVSAIK